MSKINKFLNLMVVANLTLDTNNQIYGDLSKTDYGEFLALVSGKLSNILASTLPFVKVLGTLITLTLIFLFVWLFLRSSQKSHGQGSIVKPSGPPEEAKGPIISRWEEIERHLNSFRDAEWKFAIIEADKVVEDVLKKAGFEGETMADRLKLITKEQIENISGLWDAHKLRNMLVHNTEFEIEYSDVKYAIEQYKKVLHELGVMV